MAEKKSKIVNDDVPIEETKVSEPIIDDIQGTLEETIEPKVLIVGLSSTVIFPLQVDKKFDIIVDLSLNDTFRIKNSQGDRYTRNPTKANGSNNFSLRLSPEETLLYRTNLQLNVPDGYCVIFHQTPQVNFDTDYFISTTIVETGIEELKLLIHSSSRKEVYIESGTIIGSCVVVKQ